MTDAERLTFLEDKVKILEQENIETTNALYELENSLQAQIDALINYTDRKSTRLNSSHSQQSRMPSSA